MHKGIGQDVAVKSGYRKLPTVPFYPTGSPGVVTHTTQAFAFTCSRAPTKEGCSRGATYFVTTAKLGQQALDAFVTTQALCEQVCRVYLASDLVEFDWAVSSSLLDPEALRVDVSELAKPLSTADPHCGRGVGPYTHWQRAPKIPQESLVAECHTGGLHDSVILGLTTA